MTVADDAVPQGTLPIRSSIRRGIAWKVFGQGLSQCLRFGIAIVLTRLLGVEEYGTAAVAVTVAAASGLLGDLGISSAVVQAESIDRRKLSTAFVAATAIGALLTAVIVAAAHPIAYVLGESDAGALVAISGSTFFLFALGGVPRALRMRAMDFRAVEVRSIIALVVSGVVSITLAWRGFGPWALVVQQVVYAGVFVAGLWFRIDWAPRFEFSRADFRSLFSFGVRVANARLFYFLDLFLTGLLIGRLVGISELGIWTFALNVVLIPAALLVAPIADVLFSGLSRIQHDRDEVAVVWLRGIRWVAAAVMPLLVGLAVTAGELIPLVFGRQWEVAVSVIQVLCVLAIVRALMMGMNVAVTDAAGRPNVVMHLNLTSLVVSQFAVIIGSRWGIDVVALIYLAFAIVFVNVPSFIITIRQLGIAATTVLADLVGVTFATLVFGATTGVVEIILQRQGAGDAMTLVAALATGLVVYLGMIRLVAPDLWQATSAVRRRLGARLRGGLAGGLETKQARRRSNR